jgi:hypothetical protein
MGMGCGTELLTGKRWSGVPRLDPMGVDLLEK